MIKIQPQYLSLSQLLNGRLFRIPEYQRAYSWNTHQRKDLFEDLEKTYRKGDDEGHFMAAIVCLNRNSIQLGSDKYDVMEIVDGQQRITTLVVLLKALSEKLDVSNRSDARIRREITELLVKVEADELLLLQTNHDSSLYFSNYIKTGVHPESSVAESVADKQLLEAIHEATTYVDKWCGEHSRPLQSLAALLKNRLFFLLHEIDDEKSVYTVFEVLNSRGLEVSWLDRLKSILMGAAFELENANKEGVISDLHNTWRDIYAVIGLNLGMNSEVLRFAATLRKKQEANRVVSEPDAVDMLRDQSVKSKEIRGTASWLHSVTCACSEVTSNKRINAVTKISQARLLAVAIALREDISKNHKRKLLECWERVTFRIFGMIKKDARTKVGDYVRLAWNVINNNLDYNSIKSAIIDIGRTYPIEDAIDAIANSKNCYENWGQELRYFMYKYDKHLENEQGHQSNEVVWNKIWLSKPDDSIEHIWPQSKAPAEYVHRLGNLMLLSPRLNSKLQDKPPKEKSDRYNKTGLLIAQEVASTIDNSGWGKQAISDREKALLEWARLQWGDE